MALHNTTQMEKGCLMKQSEAQTAKQGLKPFGVSLVLTCVILPRPGCRDIQPF
jgi:hypothetical protein